MFKNDIKTINMTEALQQYINYIIAGVQAIRCLSAVPHLPDLLSMTHIPAF